MDMHGIDLNLLVAFDALLAERSVTRAAARTRRTQPAMSAALARLRALFEDELFVRSPRGLQPTPRALDLGGPISEALAQIRRTLEFTQRFDPAAADATFTLALSDHPAFVLLPGLVARIAAQAPGAALQVRGFSHRDHAEELLESGFAHAAVGVPAPWGASILTAPLFEERFVTVVRRGHPLAGKRPTLKRFLAFPHVLVSPEGDRRGLVDAKLAEHGLTRRLGLALPHMYAVPRIVAASDLIATVMAGVVAGPPHHAELRVLEPPLELPSVPFVLAWHRRNDAHPAQRWLRDAITEAAGAARAAKPALSARRS